MGFAPPPHSGFAFLAAHGCACMTTPLPLGDEFAMNLEGVGIASFEISDVFRDFSAV
jgi:hypothetical protein